MTTYLQEVFGSQTSRFGSRRIFANSTARGAFTLVELLVVISIFAVLAALLFPALNRSRSRAQAIMCMNNNKQVVLAWTMYSGDNNERLTYNQGPNIQTLSYPPISSPNWMNNIMNWETNSANTNLNFVNQSILAPYATYSARIYHCPADRVLSPVQRAAGWSGRVRSISMNAMVGDPGSMLSNGGNLRNAGYQQFLNENDFRDPSAIFVFLDEHPDSIDDGYFLNSANLLEWQDLPASYHNGGGSFSFADGHTEIHRWQVKSTLRPSLPDAARLPISLVHDNLTDFNWLMLHTSYSTQ